MTQALRRPIIGADLGGVILVLISPLSCATPTTSMHNDIIRSRVFMCRLRSNLVEAAAGWLARLVAHCFVSG